MSAPVMKLDWTSEFYHRGGDFSMSKEELERHISELRSGPLLLLCRTSQGREQVMTVGECVEAGAVYIRLVANDLDELLAAELGEK